MIWSPAEIEAWNWVPLAVFAAVFVGTVTVGFVYAPYELYSIECAARRELEKEREPNILIEFENSADFITPTPVSLTHQYQPDTATRRSGRGYWVRVKATNLGDMVAERCRPFLLGVEVLVKNGTPKQTKFADPLCLLWANKRSRDESTSPIDLYHDVPQFIDVVAADNKQNRLILQVDPLPARLQEILKYPGIFRLTIQVVGEGARSDAFQLDVVWTGQWNELIARTI